MKPKSEASSLKATLALSGVPLLLAIEYRVDLGAASFTLSEVASLVVVGTAILLAARHQRVAVEWPELILTLLIGVAALVGVFIERDMNHALSKYRDLMAPLVLFVVLASLRLDRGEIVALVKTFVLVATATAALGLVQYATGRYLWFLRPEDVAWQEFKTAFIRSVFVGEWLRTGTRLPAGLYATTNNFASYLVVPCLVAYALGWMPRARMRSRVFWAICFGILLASLLLTFSRGSIFSFLMAWAVVWAFRRRHRIKLAQLAVVGAVGVVGVLLIILSGLLSFDQLGTVEGRFVMIRAAGDLLMDFPQALLVGGFTENYRAHYYADQLVHNTELYLIIQYGLLATLAWLCIVLLQIRRLYGLLRSPDAEVRNISLALLAGLGVMVLVYAQTTSFADHVETTMWLFFWLGVAVHLDRVSRSPTVWVARRLDDSRPLEAIPT